jgi:hypothetical protein
MPSRLPRREGETVLNSFVASKEEILKSQGGTARGSGGSRAALHDAILIDLLVATLEPGVVRQGLSKLPVYQLEGTTTPIIPKG